MATIREYLGLGEFYITNVCNMACQNCNRFNDVARKGHIKFNEEQYIEFATRFELGVISIIGGEPLLHPGLLSYVKGLRKLWPTSDLIITSNGMQLNKVKHLYEYCVANRCSLEISFHDEDDLDKRLWNEIEIFKKQNGFSWNAIQDEVIEHTGRDGEKFTTTSQHLTDEGGFKFLFTDAHTFSTTNVREYDGMTPLPHDSDPAKAYHDCSLKFSHTFFNGDLYKCGFIAAAKEFVTERNAEHLWKPLYDYKPVNMKQWDSQWRDKFFSPEDVCRVCSERANYGKCKTWLKKEYEKDNT